MKQPTLPNSTADIGSSGGLIESLLHEVIRLQNEVIECRRRIDDQDAAVSVTASRAAELLTGRKYGDPDCLTAQTVMRLVKRGKLVRVPSDICSTPLITTQSLKKLIHESPREF